VLYASGEESTDQVRLRARRIGQGAEDVLFIATTDSDVVLAAANETAPDVLCLDSVQTISSARLESAAGSVSQIRETTARVQDFAKRSGTSAILVGHVTKGGALAGPKALEHLVDVVLHFSGRRAAGHRLLHATKNRFGSADEIGAFRMTAAGLEEVEDPSELFLAERQASVSGSALALPLQGSRALVAEVQALTTPSRYATAQRVVTGFPPRRLALLAAVLERRAGLSVAESDVFVNVVGGLRLTDPAADLALAAALASAHMDRALPERTGYVGEVGLGGEVRGGGTLEARLRAAERAGLTEVVVPEGSVNRGEADGGSTPRIRVVQSVRDVVALLEG
jgi:DNA repair protein RadA/Sms